MTREDHKLFNKAAYRKSKEHVVARIQATHDWKKTEGFIADGIICPDIYEKQTLRILCILAESYGYHDHGVINIELQAQKDILGLCDANVQTTRRLASFLYLLQASVERGQAGFWVF